MGHWGICAQQRNKEGIVGEHWILTRRIVSLKNYKAEAINANSKCNEIESMHAMLFLKKQVQ